MRERKQAIYHCTEANHHTRVMFQQQLDAWKRHALHQDILHCSYRTELLCKIEINPVEGESRCPAAQLAKRNQFR